MSTIYTRDYFIAKFSAIPDELWCTGCYAQEDGRRCAMGHLGVRSGFEEDTDEIDEAAAIRKFFGAKTSTINDGRDQRYRQPTPKARILAALADLKP